MIRYVCFQDEGYRKPIGFRTPWALGCLRALTHLLDIRGKIPQRKGVGPFITQCGFT
jgi:hypothetical protein